MPSSGADANNVFRLYGGRLNKTLPKQHARRSLPYRIRQRRGNLTDKDRIFLADIDLDPDKALVGLFCPVPGDGGVM